MVPVKVRIRWRKILAVLLVLCCISITSITCKPDSSSEAPAFDKSPEMQQKREKLIKDLVAEGIFAKVNPEMSEVWVGSRFYALDFDQKKTFISVVYAYLFDDTKHAVYLMDRRTGKEVGRFHGSDATLELN